MISNVLEHQISITESFPKDYVTLKTVYSVFRFKNVFLNCKSIAQYYCFYSIVDQMNATNFNKTNIIKQMKLFLCNCTANSGSV